MNLLNWCVFVKIMLFVLNFKVRNDFFTSKTPGLNLDKEDIYLRFRNLRMLLNLSGILYENS